MVLTTSRGVVPVLVSRIELCYFFKSIYVSRDIYLIVSHAHRHFLSIYHVIGSSKKQQKNKNPYKSITACLKSLDNIMESYIHETIIGTTPRAYRHIVNLGIKPILARVKHPQTNGKLEKWLAHAGFGVNVFE